MICAKCRREAASYFKVERISHGNVVLTAETCSVACLLGWTYDYATLQGAQVAAGMKQKFEAAKGAISSLIDAVKRR